METGDSSTTAASFATSVASLEQEPVLSPPATRAAKPGHLWGGLPQSQVAESDRALQPDAEQSASLPALPEDPVHACVVQLRNDLNQKLCWHEEILNEILRRVDRPRGPPPSLVASGLAKPSHEEKEMKKENSNRSHVSKVSSLKASPGDPSPRRSSFTPHLFSTFTHYDLALQDVANTAEGNQNRMRFARTRGSFEKAETSWVENLVRSPLFDVFCALIVVSNSIFLGVEVQMGVTYFAEGLPLPPAMSVVQYVYAAWFLVELLLRIRADGWVFIFTPDWAWNLLDVFVVLTSIWEVAAELIYTVLQNDIGDVAGMSGLKAFRIIRITRVVKVVRLMRVFRFVMAFRTLITSIADTLKSLFWALMLLGVIVYVFAVLFTQAVNDYVLDPESPELPLREADASHRYYRSLYHTMLSLFMGVSGGINWCEVMAPLMEISPLWVALFLFYICFTYFAVLNVVTGVFCQTAIESAQNDHAAVVHSILKNKQAHIKKIRALFSCLGDDQTGIITFAMFEEKINSPAVKAYFEVLGLDVWDAWSFFKLLDLDDGGDVEIEEFLMGCLRLRGTARAIDVNKLIHDQTWLIRSHGKFQTYVEVELKKIQEQLLWMAGLSPPEQSYTLGSLSSSTGSGSCGLRNSRQRPSQRPHLATPDTKDS